MSVIEIPYIKNADIGSLAPTIALHTADATAKYTIGQRYSDNLGRTFRYCYFNAAGSDVGPGKLVSPDFNDADVQGSIAEFDNITAVTSGATADTDTGTHAAGHRFIRLTHGTAFDNIVANQLRGCLLGVTDDTGEGYTYTILKNSAVSSDMVRFELDEGIVTALDTTSDLAVCPNLCSQLQIATASSEVLPIGVTVTNVDVSETPYAWVLTRGPVLALADGTIAAGDNLTLSDGVDGAFQLKDAETEALIGTAIHAPDSTGYGFILFTGGLD